MLVFVGKDLRTYLTIQKEYFTKMLCNKCFSIVVQYIRKTKTKIVIAFKVPKLQPIVFIIDPY